jgi:hypothetical protein
VTTPSWTLAAMTAAVAEFLAGKVLAGNLTRIRITEPLLELQAMVRAQLKQKQEDFSDFQSDTCCICIQSNPVRQKKQILVSV